MTKITDNIEELRKIINEDSFKVDEALEFLEAIENGATDLEMELDAANDEIKSKEERITELEDELELQDTSGLETMECGIDVIEYKNPGNLVLQDVMENLGSAIQKHTPKKVNEVLAAIS